MSACRTAIGSFGGALKDVSAVDMAAVVIREAMTRAGVDERGCRRCHPRLRAAGRCGHERRATGGAEGGAAERSAGRNRQPRLRLRPPERGACRGGDPCRLRRHHRRRRHRVDEQRAVPAEERPLGLPHGQRRGDRLDDQRRSYLRHRPPFTWASPPRKWRHGSACRARIRMRSRPRASGAPPRRLPPAPSSTRSCRSA